MDVKGIAAQLKNRATKQPSPMMRAQQIRASNAAPSDTENRGCNFNHGQGGVKTLAKVASPQPLRSESWQSRGHRGRKRTCDE
jgi:hypothetical protein